MKLVYADDAITDLLDKYMEQVFPKEYAELKVSSERGKWVKEYLPAGTKLNGGVFLGRVTLYKLQTALHMDGGDYLCVSFCGGDFEGGEGLFPDLKMKFRYDLCLSNSNYHSPITGTNRETSLYSGLRPFGTWWHHGSQ